MGVQPGVAKPLADAAAEDDAINANLFYSLLVLSIAEWVAFGILAQDAKNKRTQQISTRTVLGLTVCAVLSIFNWLSTPATRPFAVVSVVSTLLGLLAFRRVSQTTQVNGDDEWAVSGLPRWMTGTALIYMLTLVAGTFALLVVCKGSPSATIAIMLSPDAVCTYENFLHAFALVPQLLVCRRQGFVSPAAVRFLFVIGMKQLCEFTWDAWTTYKEYAFGEFEIAELGHMSGDLLAAVVLLDFLYLVAKDRKVHLLFTGDLELELVEDMESGGSEKALKAPQHATSPWRDWSQFLVRLGSVVLPVPTKPSTSQA